MDEYAGAERTDLLCARICMCWGCAEGGVSGGRMVEDGGLQGGAGCGKYLLYYDCAGRQKVDHQ